MEINYYTQLVENSCPVFCNIILQGLKRLIYHA